MGLIQWNESLVVNVAEIDRQHEKLVAMINELNAAMSQGKGKDALGKIIGGLILYAGTHFRTEEKYFDQFGYPAAAEHKKQHVDFTQKVADFKAKFDANKISLSIEVLNFLSGWLQNHIKGTDKQYAPFFHEKGLR